MWHMGKRQFGSKFLDLKDIKIISGINVERMTFDTPEDGLPRATAVDVADSQRIKAMKEIIISSGSYNSPKILMLSGIGDEKTLASHSINCIYDNPEVGKNLCEHLSYATIFKLKKPAGLGGPNLNSPGYSEGFPADFSYHGPCRPNSRREKRWCLTRRREIPQSARLV